MDVQSKLSNASATINILFLVQAGDSFHFYYDTYNVYPSDYCF